MSEELVTISYFKSQEFLKFLANWNVEKHVNTSTYEEIENYKLIDNKIFMYYNLDDSYFSFLEKLENSDNPLTLFLEAQYEVKIRSVCFFDKLLKLCIRNNILDLFTYLFQNYPKEIILDKKYHRTSILVDINPIFLNLDRINFIQVFHQTFPKNFFKCLDRMFLKNFKSRNNDVVTFLLENFKRKISQLAFIDFYIRNNHIDCVETIFKVYPKFFDVISNWSLNCEMEIAKIFFRENKLKKICPLILLQFPDFLIEFRHEFDIHNFISEKFDKHYRIIGMRILKLILIIRDYTDHENVISFYSKSQSQHFKLLAQCTIDLIRNNREY